MQKITLISLVLSSVLMAGGYKLPETSTNSLALSGANVAHVKSADAAYDNPANMVFMSDENQMEVDVMYVGLSSTNFKGRVGANPAAQDLNAESQTFIIPSIHYVSPKLGSNDVRVGFSLSVPGGLTREWKQEPARTSAEEFTLRIIEINPSVAYAINKKVALAFGFRVVHTSGIVKSNGIVAVQAGPTYLGASRDMSGSSLDFGYNLALAYHPTDKLEIGVTYRSNVNLTPVGDAKLKGTANGGVIGQYNGGATVSVPLPATFSTALAYTFETKTTLELVYEVAYWSAYKTLDFKYDNAITSPLLVGAFATPIAKNWEDTNTFRLGLTQELGSLTLRAGLVIDATPTPESTLNFESPGSDSTSVSFGVRYAIDESIDLGFSALYSMKDDRTITTNVNGINGQFTNSTALLISAGLGYKF